jgi:hypothetical protein
MDLISDILNYPIDCSNNVLGCSIFGLILIGIFFLLITLFYVIFIEYPIKKIYSKIKRSD